MADQGPEAMYAEYEAIKSLEQRKNNLIEELLRRYDQLSLAHEQELLDHAREKQFNRDVQLREQHLQKELRSCKDDMEREAFILVLIDGDGMIFNDDLIKKGEVGGKEAASMLWDAVKDYVQTELPDLPLDYKIMTRIYANLKGLGEACTRAGLLQNPSVIQDFAHGLTGTKHLFDFVDVGVGKDRADDKINEILKLHINNCHCRHIMFGCSHDNGYARLLEDATDRKNLDQITLLEGVPFERELAALQSKYRSTRFEGLFRTQKINLHQHYMQPPPTHKGSSHIGAPNPTYESPYQPPQPAYQAPQPYYQSTQGVQATYGQTQPVQQTPQRPSSTMTNGNPKMNPNATSWATAALSAAARPASPPPTPQRSPAVPSVNRNKYGQRIDDLVPYDKEAIKRMKALKLCNIHFLKHDCPYGDNCSHIHNYKVNRSDLITLKALARQAPCKFGSACEEPACIYGHRCPAAREGEKHCIFGDSCRFPEDLHGIDMKVVQTTKIGK